MNRFDERWAAAVKHARARLDAQGMSSSDATTLGGLLERLHFPGQLVLLADPAAGSGPVGSDFIDAASTLAARQPALSGAGLDAETLAHLLRAILVERRTPDDLVADETLQAVALEAAARYLRSQGVPVTPDQARMALRLLLTGEVFRDVGASTAAIVHVVPTLPLAIGRDIPRLPHVLTRLVAAILLDAPGVALEAAKSLGTLLLDGRPGPTPRVMTRTMRTLYELASARAVAETLRTLVSRDNESFRLALVLYARANGVPLDESHLDGLHDSVLNTDDPDLGPALVAAIEHYQSELHVDELRKVLRRFQGADEPRAVPTARGLVACTGEVARADELEPPTRFEAVVFRMRPEASDAPDDVVRRRLGPEWDVAAFSRSAPRDYEAIPRRAVSLGEGWDAVSELAADPAVERSEPRVETHAADAVEPDGARSIFGTSAPDPATDDRKWSPKLVRVFEAWARVPADGGARFGEGIVVGHLDTGYTVHRELDGWIVTGHDFLDGDDDATDPLDGFFPWRFPGHGTGTASVLASADEPNTDRRLTGVAPGVRIMPLRVSRSVIHLSLGNVTKAIYYAVDHGCHVVSMSLGGPIGFDYLHDAVRYAVERGVILVAAAGNQVGFVTHPAVYEEVLAVGGCNVDKRPWPGSCRGSAVDISAPAGDVWRALAGSGDGTIERGSGTSFATATVAGVAALWLAFHGRDRLITKYGRANLAMVFRDVVRSTCQGGIDWDPNALGPGIIDADAVLAAPLPSGVPRALVPRRPPAPPAEAVLRDIEHQFPTLDPLTVRARVAHLFATHESELSTVLAAGGRELLMLLATDREVRAGVLPPAATARDGAAPDHVARARERLAELKSSRL